MRRADKKAAARIRQSMVAAEAVFKRDELSMTLGGQNILEILTRAALDAASFSGCGVSVGVPADITLGDGFDRHLFGMFLLLFFMSARENSPERRAKVVMSDGFEGLVVRAECEVFEDRAYRIMPLINTVSSFSERYNIRCSCALNGNRLTVEFCPVRKDWSLLDMKTSFVFDWKS
ncbi:MAG: hypothetical protein IJV72_02325 [Clostridia bacterium]|nr:hypothetical protein [Clostridia bacterium]